MDIATAALIRKRAELSGEAEALDARLGQLRADLVHLDAAIRILCPDAAPELIRPRKPSRTGRDRSTRDDRQPASEDQPERVLGGVFCAMLAGNGCRNPPPTWIA